MAGPHLGPEKALREEHDLTDLLQVRHNHHHGPEECLHRLRQLRAACVAGVHGDEDAHSRVQGDLLPFKLENRRKEWGYAACQPTTGAGGLGEWHAVCFQGYEADTTI